MVIVQCTRCGKTWKARTDSPKKCRYCFSYFWNIPRRRKYYTRTRYRNVAQDQKNRDAHLGLYKRILEYKSYEGIGSVRMVGVAFGINLHEMSWLERRARYIMKQRGIKKDDILNGIFDRED